MGFTVAFRLSQNGHNITIFEAKKQLGGLATYHDYGSFIWDRFYHVILPSDTYLIDFINEIGLRNKLRWRRTLTGIYVDQQFYSISNTLEFLRFPPLGLVGKAKLALTILYCSCIKDWWRLEQIPLEDWLIKIGGKNTFKKIWEPLLLAKLGENYRRVSAVFIWSYIKRMFSARDTSAQKEQLGYVEGGYKAVFERLSELILGSGGQIKTNTSIEQIQVLPDGGLIVSYNGKVEKFDKIIYTGPISVLQRIVSRKLVDFSKFNQPVEYLGVINMVLISRKELIPYYVLNITDKRIPFTGIIGVSNVVSLNETAKRHITYLPKYILSEDPLLKLSDSRIQNLFLKGLRLMFPHLQEKEIETIHINRAFEVQPLQVMNYSRIIPTITTKHKDFFVLNNAQFVNDTLNNNSVVRHVGSFIKQYGHLL